MSGSPHAHVSGYARGVWKGGGGGARAQSGGPDSNQLGWGGGGQVDLLRTLNSLGAPAPRVCRF